MYSFFHVLPLLKSPLGVSIRPKPNTFVRTRLQEHQILAFAMKLHQISLALVGFLGTAAAQGMNGLPDCAVSTLIESAVTRFEPW